MLPCFFLKRMRCGSFPDKNMKLKEEEKMLVNTERKRYSEKNIDLEQFLVRMQEAFEYDDEE